ncbi:MAG: hypothetical protein E7588_02090 [Ruminococcaceae bacterium]|nr:hypothetical protein [Oscillospiraceae bacterium]
MKEIAIKDIYSGKPDAKDEINFSVSDEFIRTFVVAEHFNLDSLLTGSNCFITGFKGTGKTALLYYLDNRFKEMDEASCSSFIFFKDDFTDIKRSELNEISRRILTSITVEKNALVDSCDFEYIWRWLFFKRIVSDNEDCSRNLFVDDEYWKMYEKLVSSIKDPINTKKSIIPNKIKMAWPFKDNSTMTETGPEFEVDLENISEENYKKFTSLIDEAEKAFSKVNRTDIPYNIFVDELEAYFGDEKIFKRDLCLIRDLIFTVKRLNSVITKSRHFKMKIICSVRSEILNAISRFVITKEINKVITGFSMPLNWNYSNTSSYAHPIIQILLKRIAVCSDCEEVDSFEIYKKWFPEEIHGVEAAAYILNNSWCKPRDMVRLITSAQNCIYNNNKSFSVAVLNSLTKSYSDESLGEIREELRALYSSADIDTIISCFTGYKTVFSVAQLKERISKYYSNTILQTDFLQVLNDLYRLGFIGNFLPKSKSYHWQHKGDGMLILSDEWRLAVHFALHRALSLGSRNNIGLNINQKPEIGDVTCAVVTKIIKYFVLVKFDLYGKEFVGSIHISEFKKLGHGFIENLSNIVSTGEEFDVVVVGYNNKYESWNLEINAQTDKID